MRQGDDLGVVLQRVVREVADIGVQSAGIEKNSVWTGISVGSMVGCVVSVGFGPAVGVVMGAQPANMSMTMAMGTMIRPRPIFDVNCIIFFKVNIEVVPGISHSYMSFAVNSSP